MKAYTWRCCGAESTLKGVRASGKRHVVATASTAAASAHSLDTRIPSRAKLAGRDLGKASALGAAVLPSDCIDDLHDERLQRLLDYWRGLCTDGMVPAKEAIDPLDFRYILGYVTLVDVEAAPRRYRFRLDGSRLVELSGVDYTGKYLDQLGMPDYIDFIAATYDRVVDGGRPYAYRKEGAFDELMFDEETLILPLGQAGAIRHLMVAVIPGELAPEKGKAVI